MRRGSLAARGIDDPGRKRDVTMSGATSSLRSNFKFAALSQHADNDCLVIRTRCDKEDATNENAGNDFDCIIQFLTP